MKLKLKKIKLILKLNYTKIYFNPKIYYSSTASLLSFDNAPLGFLRATRAIPPEISTLGWVEIIQTLDYAFGGKEGFHIHLADSFLEGGKVWSLMVESEVWP